MEQRPIVTRAEWLEVRRELLEAEKALTRQGDEVTRQRLALPWVRVEQPYAFDAPRGRVTLRDLFGGRSQLLVYHFMLGPGWDAGCPSCSSIADGIDGTHVHLEHHDVAFTAVSRAPLDEILAYQHRMGWRFPWVSSAPSDFNFDFNVSFTADGVRAGQTYNYRSLEAGGFNPADPPAELPGLSAFALVDGEVFHTYSAYARGLDAIWNMWQWFDRAPAGRNEGDESWFHRHDEYE